MTGSEMAQLVRNRMHKILGLGPQDPCPKPSIISMSVISVPRPPDSYSSRMGEWTPGSVRDAVSKYKVESD